MSEPTDDTPIRWGADGLATVVTTDAASGDVLMVASMNAEALARTRETGIVHYWSRSRSVLWRKGATSGHEQRLVEIRVNCNRDSLLLRVEQRGAACHDGYPTCYYRRLEPDGSLTEVADRAFDPADVYGAAASPSPLPALVRDWFGAYAVLRDEDHEAVSGTSRRLRADRDEATTRLADELNELAGVLDGSHRHRSFEDDVALEATQCLYWVVLVALRSGIDGGAFVWWAVQEIEGDMSRSENRETLGVRVRKLAAGWRDLTPAPGDRLRATLALIAGATAAAGHDLPDLIAADLTELRTKPYLAAYFGRLPVG